MQAWGDTFMSTDAPFRALAEKGAITNVDTKAIEAQVEHLRAGPQGHQREPRRDSSEAPDKYPPT